jgi:UDP-glucose 4-epimerase
MLEEQTPQPEDPYGISKYAVELDLRAAHRMFGLKFVIFRPHNVFGEHQNLGDRYRNVVGIFMRQALCGRRMSIFGDGSQTRAFSYIEDVAPYIARSVIVPEAQNQVFNVGADHPVSVLRMAHLVAGALGVEPRLEFLPRRSEVAHAFSSQEKIRSVFGAQPSVSVEEGVSRMAQWAKSLGSLAEPPPFAAIEVPMQLPPSWVEADKS